MSEYDAFPLFSPSQISCNKEKVLHSVFSPSFGGAAIMGLDSAARAITGDNTSELPFSHKNEHGREEQCRDGHSVHVISCGSKSNCEKMKESAIGDQATRYDPPSSINVEESKFTPVATHQKPMVHPGSALRGRVRDRNSDRIPRTVTFRSDTRHTEKSSPDDTDCFKSPEYSAQDQQFDDMSSPNLFMSPIPAADDCSRSQAFSVKSTHTTTSWHSVPIEMLNIDFVANCDSEHQLEKIISALTEDSPARYPALLRMAKTRLETFQKAVIKKEQNCHDQIDGSHMELSCSGLVGSAIEPNEVSSSVMNFSASIHDGKQDDANRASYAEQHNVDAPSNKHSGHNSAEVEEFGDSKKNGCGGAEHHPTTFFELKENLATVLAAHSSLSAELDNALMERDYAQKELKTQMRICRDLERKIKSQNGELCAKIASLERARDEAQADIATLEDTLVSSSAKAREVALRLAQRTDEVEKLREELQKTRYDATAELAGHQNLHKMLREKIDELSNQLSLQEQKAAEKLELLEQQLKDDFDKVSEQQQAKIKTLSASLADARRGIDRLRKENSELSSNTDVASSGRHLDKDLRTQYNNALAQAKSTEMAANAMAEALARSETELASANERRDECEQKCGQLIEANTTMKSENKELSNLLNQVSEELASSDVYVDKLLDELEALKEKEGDSDEIRKMKEEMVHREKIFHSEVHQLKSKIKDQESWVPMDVYQKVLSEAKTLSKLRSCMESEIKELSTKNHRLEAMAKTAAEDPGKFSSSTLPDAPATTKGDSNNAVSVLKECSAENKLSSPKKVTPLSTNIPGKSLARISAVRAAGGRAALSAKLKKTRGSVLRRNHQVQGQQKDSHCQILKTNAISWSAAAEDKENLKFYR